jgi:WD40 repeat protein
MKRSTYLLTVLFVISGTNARALAQTRPDHVSFRRQVAPILVKTCLACHDDRKASGGLSMATFAALQRGGKSVGEAILDPGDPDSSYLITSIRRGAPIRMPYKQPPLKDDEVAVLTRWVKEGAEFDGPSAAETPLAALVDVLADLPKVALKVPAADAVSSLAFSPDGRLLAAAVGRQVVLYEAGTGKLAATLGDHPGPVTSVRFTPDGGSLVAAGGRPGLFGSVAVWDVTKRRKRLEVAGHSDAILAAEVAPGHKMLATAGYDKQVLIWDLVTGKVVRRLKDHSDAVYGLAFSPDGKTLASCAADRTVKLWDWATGRRTVTLSESTGELYAVAFTPDGSRVLAAGVDRSIRMWRVEGHGASARLERSAFAHDAPVLRLAVSADGKRLASSAEDRTVRLWELNSLTPSPRESIPAQTDWVAAVAFSPDGHRLALGRYDGSLAFWDVTSQAAGVVLREPPKPKSSRPPELLRNASLNPPQPRGGTRGSRVKVTLTGVGVGRAAAVIIPEPGLAATILPAARLDPNRADVELAIAPDARIGLHTLGVVTPLGVPSFQTFAVVADPEITEREPNDRLDQLGGKPVVLPATLLGTIERPGDVDVFRIGVKAGQRLVFQVMARSLGSQLRPVLSLLEPRGDELAQSTAGTPGLEPVLTYTARNDGVIALQVADADYGGSGGHFYRIAAGENPYVHSVFPLGVERGTTARIEVRGSNLGDVREVSLPVGPGVEPGTILGVPVALTGGRRPYATRDVVAADGRQVVEQETNDDRAQAQELAVPGGASGRIDHDGDVDFYRFPAKKGETLIVEVFGQRLGSPIDSVVRILDARGQPIPRAVLRPVDQSETAFRDHQATSPAIRLTHWDNLAVNDYLLVGRELMRIQALPRNLDDDCVFWGQQGQRLGWLETTPEQHPQGQPMYKVEIHPPGTVFPPSGVPTTTLNYQNDDGGPSYSKDSRVTFRAPADGEYLVRVEDVRGLGGDDSAYHLVLRRPRPSFQVLLGTENPSISRGGTELVNLTLIRRDGFDAAVEVVAEGLPPGITATPARIAADELGGILALSADKTAPAFSPPSWRVVAREVVPPSTSQERPPQRQEIDPGGPAGGRITVTAAANLKVAARPGRVVIRPGERVSMTLAVERAPGFSGRVPIDVKNLPQGVRVLDIGLNGVLITETQVERSMFLLAEPWVQPMVRPFYAVAKAESAGTEDSSPPIELVVTPSSRNN